MSGRNIMLINYLIKLPEKVDTYQFIISYINNIYLLLKLKILKLKININEMRIIIFNTKYVEFIY